MTAVTVKAGNRNGAHATVQANYPERVELRAVALGTYVTLALNPDQALRIAAALVDAARISLALRPV